jgi:rubredoxin
MKQYYLTSEGMPVKTNCPQKDWIEITEEEYTNICNKKNKQIKDKQKAFDESMKPVIEQQKRIQSKMEEMALSELCEEKLSINKE